MEVHGKQPGDPSPAQERFRRRQEALQESNHGKVKRARQAREDLPRVHQKATAEAQAARAKARKEVRDQATQDAGARKDVIDISRAVDSSRTKADQAERDARIRHLRDAFNEGALNTPERIDKAAEGILLK